MTENNKEISPVFKNFRFIEPVFTTQYCIVLHHDAITNEKHGTVELVNYPYFRHYGIQNTVDPNQYVKANFSAAPDPLFFLDNIHREQDGLCWLLETSTIEPPPGMEKQLKRKRVKPTEIPTESYGEEIPDETNNKKICVGDQVCNFQTCNPSIALVCSSLCAVSFPHRIPKNKNQFTQPPWCGVCTIHYNENCVNKVINIGGSNKLFLTYNLKQTNKTNIWEMVKFYH